MLDEADVEPLTSSLWVEFLENRRRSEEWQLWALGRQALPELPSDTNSGEYADLQERATTPWLSLVVQSLVQSLYVEGFRTDGDHEDQALWHAWQQNRMDARQASVYEASATTGVSYVAILPQGTPGEVRRPMLGGDVPTPEWRCYSSTSMTAFYDSANSEWPTYALAGAPAPSWRKAPDLWHVQLLDDTHVHTLEVRNGIPVVIGDPVPHGSNVVPVVKFVNRETIDGRAIGEVEPYTTVASRIDQDVFDRLVVQRFGSWRVRYATGILTPDDPEAADRQNLEMLISSLLTSDSELTQFGTLQETPLDGHLRAPLEDVRMLAAVSQTPPTVLTGDLSNISAEALAAIEGAFQRKVEARKSTLSEAWEQCFGLTAELHGWDVDPLAQVRWRDLESRSLAQVADAFGKLATQLEVPVEVLWDKLGFLTDQDRDEAKRIRDSAGSSADALLMQLAAGVPDVVDAGG